MAAGESWSDPIIYNDWTAFETAIGGTYSSTTYISLSDPHIQNGQFTGQGNGSENNPYVVSTVREMLLVTGASDLYRCKLIDDDQDLTDLTQPRRYWYNNGQRTIYCQYDPTPTIIDFNDISPTERGSILVNCYADFNGWTILNLNVHAEYGVLFSNGITSRAARHLFLANCRERMGGGYIVLSCPVWDSMLQIDADAQSVTSTVFFNASAIRGKDMYRSTVHLKLRGNPNNTSFLPCSSGYAYMEDCIIDFDVANFYNTNPQSSDIYMQCRRCTIKGTIIYSSTYGSNFCWFRNCADTILDILDSARTQQPQSCTGSVFNKTKTAWNSYSGFQGVTTDELLQPTTLQQKGLPIGVDV